MLARVVCCNALDFVYHEDFLLMRTIRTPRYHQLQNSSCLERQLKFYSHGKLQGSFCLWFSRQSLDNKNSKLWWRRNNSVKMGILHVPHESLASLRYGATYVMSMCETTPLLQPSPVAVISSKPYSFSDAQYQSFQPHTRRSGQLMLSQSSAAQCRY